MFVEKYSDNNSIIRYTVRHLTYTRKKTVNITESINKQQNGSIFVRRSNVIPFFPHLVRSSLAVFNSQSSS